MAIWPQWVRDRTGQDRSAYAELDDAALVERMKRGEMRALEALYDRYSTLVFSLALRVLTHRERAEEVVQDVFLKLWREPAIFDPDRGAFRFWLLRVAHNRAIDEVRRGRQEITMPPGDSGEDFWEAQPDQAPRPEETALAQIDREAVLAALARLTPAQREALQLAYFDGLTQAEIATRLGEPLGTVKTRVRLGIRHLRDLLDGSEARLDNNDLR